ncbi:MAG: hypothetical protein KAW14_10780 [Candidatus Aegiribacteria sp.]|nr:hypothetical protein [Candidatus Aegiribacteria sp.]
MYPVLNLCSVSVINDIGADPSCFVGDSDEDIEYCNSLADWARASGYSAILSPSAAASGKRNLTIYLTDNPSLLSIKAGPDREPLNY